ncbi:lamin tail domain-containing protein [Streptomyces sp. SCSIO 30461]|uniref:lamin tail domain-containing protein n=1 Tax=Streptomyces sp. SCSIO 30461 TaxID=3118085 RepID=UPI0030D3B9D2
MSASRTTRRIVATVLASGALVAAAALPAAADVHHRGGRVGDLVDLARQYDRGHGGHNNGRGHDRGRGHDDRRSPIVIGEVRHDGFGRDNRSNRALNSEWVEVRNIGRAPVNLRGYTISDRDGNTYRFRNLRLAGGSSVKVHTGRGFDSHRDVYQDRSRQVWNARDTATLRNDRGRVIDQESWGRGRGR